MNPLEAHEVAALLAMVRPGGRSGDNWPAKSRALLALCTYRDGDWLNAPDVEHWTGIPTSYARRLLVELERQRVIVRDGGHGPRAKVHWVEVQPDWRRWDVEWSVTLRDVEARMTHHRDRWVRPPLGRLFSRPIAARFHRVIALLERRDYARQNTRNGGFSRLPSGANREPESRLHRGAKNGSPAKESSLLGGVTESSSPDVGFAQEVAGGRSDERWQPVRHAYMAAVGAQWLNGAPDELLAALVGRHGAEPVLEAIRRAPEGLGVKWLVDHLAGELARPVPTVAELEAVTAVDTTEIANRVFHLERMIATYESDGGEAPIELRDELTRWQNELAMHREANA